MIRYLLLVVTLSSCATPSARPAARPALVPEPEPTATPVEDPALRPLLESFLAARWTFDRDAVLQFVTPLDATQPWDRALQPPMLTPKKNEPQQVWYETKWRILDVRSDGETATATVEVSSPLMTALAAVQIRMVMRMGKLMKIYAKGKPDPDPVSTLRADREIRTYVYRLRKIDGEWKVDMGWPAAAEITSLDDYDAQVDALAGFESSEKAYVSEIIEDRVRRPRDEATRELVKRIREAENAVRDHDFPAAIQLYDQLIAESPKLPEFVVERRDTLDARAQKYQQRLATAKVKVGAVTPSERGFDIEVKNLGPPLARVEIAVQMERHGRTSLQTGTSSKLMATGESAKITVHAWSEETIAGTPQVVDVRFADKDLQAKLADDDRSEFVRKLEDLRTDGRSRSTAMRVSTFVAAHVDDFDACPDWPAEPVDVRIEIGARGSKPSLQVIDPSSAAFADCVSETGQRIDFDDTVNARAIVRLYPAGHWFR